MKLLSIPYTIFRSVVFLLFALPSLALHAQNGTPSHGAFGLLSSAGTGSVVTATVNGYQVQSTYAMYQSASSFASQLAQQLNSIYYKDGVMATASGSQINLTSTAVGYETNYPFSVSGTPTQQSGPTLTGGTDNSGIVYPTYKVVSVVYAPPGNRSSNGYTNATTGSTSTSVGSSFTAGTSTTYTFSLFGNSTSLNLGSSVTTGQSTQYTQTLTNASGVADASNPTNTNAISHLQDLFVVWLNPAVYVQPTSKSSANYGIGTVLQVSPDPNPGQPQISDTVEVTAATMLANGNGATTVPLQILVPQIVSGQTLAGLAAVCAHPIYYPNSCTMANQCGCVPSDFTGILAQDPLLHYATTTNPMQADASGATACANPTSSLSCRYVEVKTNGVQESELLAGPECNSGCDYPINSFMQSDSTQTALTLMESSAVTVGYSVKVQPLPDGPSFSSSTMFTWTDNGSTGTASGQSHTQSVVFSSGTPFCYESIPVFEDTIYHTYVFSQPTGNTSCP